MRIIFDLIAKNGSGDASGADRDIKIHQDVVRPLLGVIQSAYQIMRSSYDRIFTELLRRLKGSASDYMDASEWQVFNVALMNRHLDDPFEPQYAEELEWAFRGWGSLLYAADEAEEFYDFFKLHEATLEARFDASSSLHEFVVAGLKQDLENISYNPKDKESDHQWIDAVENSARGLGVWEELAGDVEYSRTSVEEYYADREHLSPQPQPTSGAGYWPRGENRVSTTDRIVIEGMFRELS